MGLGTLLRAAAIIGACIWALFLVRGWSAYSDMQAFRGGLFDKAIGDAFQSLTIQSIFVFILFLGGIFIKGSPTEEESSGADNNHRSDHSSQSNSTFSGEPLLTNDAYKIFLTNKYGIQKNDALGKYIIQEKLFDSIDEALIFAANAEESIKSNKEKEDQLRKAQAAEERQKEADYLNSSEYKKKKLLKTIGALVLFCMLGLYIYINFNSGKSQQSQNSAPTSNGQVSKLTNNSYRDYRNEILNSGWTPYIRENQFKGWNRDYPELQFCYEDECQADFISPDKSKVRNVRYSICSADRYIQCPGKPNGFQKVYKDAVVSKTKSDEDFRALLAKFGD